MIRRRQTATVGLALAGVGALALGVGAAPATPATPKRASLSIIHVTKGCHVLMLNGAPGVVHTTVHLAKGGKLSMINNDEQQHQAVQLSGPVKLPTLADMNSLGATSQAIFTKPGVYRFKFTIGRDFVKNLKTIGPDYKMTMKVIVS
jgi:hypothetical protein